MTFTIGENIGPYRILEQLGQGGMATVYKAYHASLDRYVALKVLHPAFKEDKNFLGRFQREARLVAKLEHPNIVPIYDFAEHENHPYLVMKFIEGKTLKARLQKGKLTTEEIITITRAVGDALVYAHKKGILHRDIKPSNVLLADDGQTYLADFGLARLAAATDSTLSSDILIGTPQYISPEQANGQKDLDPRSDVYSFGVMLYEMTVGRVPFNADTPYAIVHDHIYKPLPLPRSINPALSEELEVVLLKALSKDRNDRQADVAMLVKGVIAALSTPAPAAKVDTPETVKAVVIPTAPATPPPPETVKRKKTGKARSCWVVGAWLGLIVIILFILLSVIRAGRNWVAGRATEIVPQIAVTLAAITPPVDLDQVVLQGLVTEALNAYQNKNMVEFWSLAKALEEMIGERVDVYRQVGDQMFAQEAYLPASIFYLQVFRYDPAILKPEQSIKMRAVIFQQAKGKEIAKIFAPGREDPLYQITLSRYEVYNKTDLGVTKQRMGRLLTDPKVVADYPEANLVMAEIYLKIDDPVNARRILNSLADNASLPQWVRDEAHNLLGSMTQ